jgi:hypothetical protein
VEYLEIPWRPEGAEEDDDPDDGDRGGDPRDAMAQLGRIRELMEGTAVYRVLSGGSAAIAGAIALAACGASWALLARLGAGAALRLAPLDAQALRALGWTWGAAFVSAALVEVALTKREARRLRAQTFHFPSGSPMLHRMRLAYTAPLFVGAALTLALARAGATEAIPAAWLLSYGAALLCAGLFSTRPVRALGAAFLAVGSAAALAPELNLAWLAAGFGVAHIVYGALVARGGDR